MDDRTIKIRLRARELCKKYSGVNPVEVLARNEKIIQILMEEFALTHEEAEYHFINNNEWE